METKGGCLLKSEDCGKHCCSWEIWSSGLDRGFQFVLVFFTCLQGAVLHRPNKIYCHSESGTGALMSDVYPSIFAFLSLSLCHRHTPMQHTNMTSHTTPMSLYDCSCTTLTLIPASVAPAWLGHFNKLRITWDYLLQILRSKIQPISFLGHGST